MTFLFIVLTALTLLGPQGGFFYHAFRLPKTRLPNPTNPQSNFLVLFNCSPRVPCNVATELDSINTLLTPRPPALNLQISLMFHLVLVLFFRLSISPYTNTSVHS
uniref:Secreted protein n=1 Tax=Cacopsylla melanoneura TaxID=428564 RepID=A0A8D9C1B2_9HEMI